jgi:hypothetical protein
VISDQFKFSTTVVKGLKQKVKDEIMHAKSIWANKMQKSNNGLWKLVSSVRGNKKRDHISKLLASGESIESLLEKLRSNLTECFAAPPDLPASVPPDDFEDSWNIDINEHSVRSLLSKLSPSKAPGNDGIPTKLYRCLADIIALPLTMMFRNSVAERALPLEWKKGVIIPLPKTNPPSISRLRFITLLPVPVKILEKLVLRNMRSYFESAYGPEQHGFRPRASTTTALVRLTDAASSCINDPSIFGVAFVSFDLTRAFDTIDCSLTLRKMSDAGFPGGFLRWLCSYFKNRSGSVMIRGQRSTTFPMSKGVPQGSILGPSIFCAYVRDIKSVSENVTTVKYADDINLIIPLHSSDPSRIKTIVDYESDSIANLCSVNKLILNTEKSKVLFITRRSIKFDDPPKLPQDKILKVLGLLFNEKLKWDSHIDYMCKKAAQRLHVIRKLRDLIPSVDLHQVYVSFIRSLFEYACPVFVGLNKKQSDKLRKIDKRAHKIMTGHPDNSNICNCGPSVLSNRRLATSEKLFRSIEKSAVHLLTPLMPSKLPNSKHYSIPLAVSDKYFNSFFPFMSRYLNDRKRNQF